VVKLLATMDGLMRKRKQQGFLTASDMFGEGGDFTPEAAFQHFDKDKTGFLETVEVIKILTPCRMYMSEGDT
jgi:Ca2+-binding EF-hand superfamily protein